MGKKKLKLEQIALLAIVIIAIAYIGLNKLTIISGGEAEITLYQNGFNNTIGDTFALSLRNNGLSPTANRSVHVTLSDISMTIDGMQAVKNYPDCSIGYFDNINSSLVSTWNAYNKTPAFAACPASYCLHSWVDPDTWVGWSRYFITMRIKPLAVGTHTMQLCYHANVDSTGDTCIANSAIPKTCETLTFTIEPEAPTPTGCAYENPPCAAPQVCENNLCVNPTPAIPPVAPTSDFWSNINAWINGILEWLRGLLGG